jgi:hypothetical protein
MRCVIINSETREVVEMIEADPNVDRAPKGHELVAAPDDVGCGWLYSKTRGFVMSIALKEKIEAQAIADANHPDHVTIRYIENNCDAFLDSVEAGRG